MRGLLRLTARLRRFVVLLGIVMPGSALAAPGQVYLVQASGWMDGYLNDTGGAFQATIADFVRLTQVDGWPIAVASFNRQDEARLRPGDCSPRTLYPVDGCDETSRLAPWSAGGVAGALAEVRIPKNPNGSLANAFLDEALLRARDIELGANPQGVVWIVTNNKNAPIGEMSERAVIDSSRRFLRSLTDDPQITAVSAIPVEMRAASTAYPRFGVHSGFMIYGVAYGESGRLLLRYVTSRPDLIATFGHAFKVRPLDDEPLRLRIAAQKVDDAVDVAEDGDDGLRVTGVQIGRRAPLVLHATLENTVYPFVIDKSSLKLAWASDTGSTAGILNAGIDPEVVAGIPPGSSGEITVTLDFSAVRPEELSWFKSQRFEESGRLQLQMSDLELSADPAALGRLRKVYLGNTVGPDEPSADRLAIPDIFLAGHRVAKSDGSIAIRFVASAFPIETLEAIGAILAALLSGGLLVAQFTTRRRQTVMIEGQPQYFPLRPLQRVVTTAGSGRKYVVRGGFFGSKSAKATQID
ncbi:MAG: hypothetical protein GX458_17345 [Phyllobacteriaceae bacterium]|nr:hypothetical protein [Phyllobacteriaceae bacterium]